MTGSRRLLELLETERFRAVFERFKEDRYPAKHFVSRPDSRRDRVFIVIEGQARVFLGFGDKELTLTFLAPGDIYSTHTRAFVQTTRESRFLSVDTALVGRTLLRYPEVTSAMIGVLGNVLRGSIEIIEDLAFRDVQERLMRFLLNVAKRSGRRLPDGSISVHLDLGTEDIACLLGTSRQTVSAFITRMVNQGVLRRQGRRRLLIRDLRALEPPG